MLILKYFILYKLIQRKTLLKHLVEQQMYNRDSLLIKLMQKAQLQSIPQRYFTVHFKQQLGIGKPV